MANPSFSSLHAVADRQAESADAAASTTPAAEGFAPRPDINRVLDVPAEVTDQVRRVFPVQWPRYYLDLAEQQGPDSAVARMGRPRLTELVQDQGDIADPIADRRQRPVPFVVQKHADRVIILATKKCHFYCRFCFRREEPVARAMELSRADWRCIFDFLRANPDIKEPILSGGDPLTLTDEHLAWVRSELETIPSVTHWRIHSRAPVHYPARVTTGLTAALQGRLPLRLVCHFNHRDEQTPQSLAAVARLQAAGVQVENQAVLLQGVNDSLAAQQALWQGLAAAGVKPRYLHHPDRVAGNAPFRVSIEQGRRLYTAMTQTLDPEQNPRYVIDLPDGTGKIPVAAMERQADGTYRYQHPDGRLSVYQDWC
ncbi:KamA family radical SAM protein [Acanthopleuribacter pedis]|uniref:KamA family radical SAM protein n=1 Tax=Acanthopleuribacter pedis TaxID=442870 RepID=A0A8J7QC48_9BACT|nr:KamA family radical SAM protein [Acanthopleuribacter pedis]MBO1321004.1 KamA family radical SAM protein [Acanthopleuribacter pedis]